MENEAMNTLRMLIFRILCRMVTFFDRFFIDKTEKQSYNHI